MKKQHLDERSTQSNNAIKHRIRAPQVSAGIPATQQNLDIDPVPGTWPVPATRRHPLRATRPTVGARGKSRLVQSAALESSDQKPLRAAERYAFTFRGETTQTVRTHWQQDCFGALGFLDLI